MVGEALYTLEPVYVAAVGGDVEAVAAVFFADAADAAAAQASAAQRGGPYSKPGVVSFCCSELDALELSGERGLLLLGLRMKRAGLRCDFFIPEDMFFVLTGFIERFMCIGALVPCDDEECAFRFHAPLVRGCGCLPDLQMGVEEFEGLEKLWRRSVDFFSECALAMYRSHFLEELGFPQGYVERTIVNIQMNTINEEIGRYPEYKEIGVEEFDTLFDENGKIIEPELFVERLYFAGVQEELLEKVLPFILGVYPYGSNSEERKKIDERCREEFQIYFEQMNTQLPEEIQNSYKKENSYRVIKHDVERTDRNVKLFRKKDGVGLLVLKDLLQTYSIFNPQISYLQGMNDLIVPIILTYLSDVNDDGIPLNKDGTIMDYKALYPKIFWLFNGLLNNTGHLSFLLSINISKVKNLEIITEILKKISPIVFEWLKNNDLLEFQWIYSEYILLFKRTFDDIWKIWVPLNCSKYPANWTPYFFAAIILDCFNKISLIEQVSIIKMVSQFPKILKEIDIHRISKIAHWIYNKIPDYVIENKIDDDIIEKFDFFELK